MEIKKLTADTRDEILDTWASDNGLDFSVIDFPKLDGSERIEGFCVTEGNQALAIFDVRDAVKHYKTMSILLAPSLDYVVGDYTKVKEVLEKIISVVAAIFSHILKNCLKEKNQFKIRNERDDIHTILTNFAQYLQNNYPDKYEIKLYKTWVEILTKEVA